MTTSAHEHADCGCPDFRASRRTFLKGTIATGATFVTTAMVGDVFTQVAYGGAADTNVLVVLSLRGGADGLSMVVPHGDTAYAAARPRIGIPTPSLLGADPMFGLHPAFAPLLPMWNAGLFAAVHAVGLPQPNRSHFAAMEAVEDADPASEERVGWINRMVGLIGTGGPTSAVELGRAVMPTALYGPAPTLAATRLKNFRLVGSADPLWFKRQATALNTVWGRVAGPLGLGARSALSTGQTLRSLSTTAVTPHNGARYPQGDLGVTLGEAATLIRAGVGTQVVTIDYGGWDMHTSLGLAGRGQMHSRIDELSRALAAFFTDLGALGDRVTVVTLSEFGRRVQENGADGLDHGHGNCVMVLGGGVQGGSYYGIWPGLGTNKLVSGDLAVTTDYRSVVCEIVRARFPDASLSALFPSFVPEQIGLMRPA
jgi:uncharacterized protein (DUF1501 family)